MIGAGIRASSTEVAAVAERKNFWTPALILWVTEMRRDGKSAAEIARSVGTTRNAVVGILHRSGVKAPEGGQRRGGQIRSAAKAASAKGSKAKQRAGGASLIVPIKPADRSDAIRVHGGGLIRAVRARTGEAVTSAPIAKAKGQAAAYDATRLPYATPLAELETGDCRFAVTAHDVPPHEHRFCGLPVADLLAPPLKAARRYCQHHMKRVVAIRDEHGHGAAR
jgi:hypothetical protein